MMKSNNKHGKVNRDFPFSFLEEQGKLEIVETQLLKDNVWKIKSHATYYILKRYTSFQSVQQQYEFFKKIDHSAIIPFHPFPNGQPYIVDRGCIWTLSPFVQSKSVSFHNRQDLLDASNVLHQFHQITTRMQLSTTLLRNPLYLKWYKRYNLFLSSQPLFSYYGFHSVYMDIVKQAHHYLLLFSQLDWGRIEKDSYIKGEWIHGDVAQHNFLRSSDNKMYLIDFDLLTQAPLVYDWIQFVHRSSVCAHSGMYIKSIPVFEVYKNQPAFRIGIQIPGDFMREWITFIKTPNSPCNIHAYLRKFENNWHNRKKFVEEIELMLL